jgi:hypothetical protein
VTSNPDTRVNWPDNDIELGPGIVVEAAQGGSVAGNRAASCWLFTPETELLEAVKAEMEERHWQVPIVTVAVTDTEDTGMPVVSMPQQTKSPAPFVER